MELSEFEAFGNGPEVYPGNQIAPLCRAGATVQNCSRTLPNLEDEEIIAYRNAQNSMT